MALDLGRQFFAELGELRWYPTAKRIRALIGDETVVDSTDARLVWEPRRIVPSYAVPVGDIRAALAPDDTVPPEERPLRLGGGPPVLDPSHPFAIHSCDGQAYSIAAGRELPGAAFRPTDAELDGYAVLDFRAFDGWLEEDEPIVAHPRDPFKRIDIRRSSRHVVLEIAGVPIADSTRPTLLFETHLPTRFYLPPEDIRTDLLMPSATTSACAYKGYAEYWSATIDGTENPRRGLDLPRSTERRGAGESLIGFFDERVDVIVDGQRRERPVTPWS